MVATLKRGKRVALFCVIAVAIVIADQLAKVWIRAQLPRVGDTAPLIPGIIRLQRVENTGAAFSFGEGSGWVFVAVALAVCIVALVWIVRSNLEVPLAISLAAVAGGGFSNMLDRIYQGSVTDFFAIVFMKFPVFNVADIFVTVGVIATLICIFAGEGDNAD
ncbi:MAG: signal peptidase II [Coriobacteriaceae bacterium]|jgi:signal peptidase II|nr:MAG: signal peptidase II [Coriobacteriaceae bacterium]